MIMKSRNNISYVGDLCCLVGIYMDSQFMHIMVPTLYAIPNLVNKRGIAKRQSISFK